VLLAILGAAAGSLAGALAWRLKHGGDWLKGRSRCERCSHRLAPRDLIPIFSWLSLSGRCRYCRGKISVSHPLVEVVSATVFVLSYLFWPGGLHTHQAVFNFSFWLVTAVGLLALAIYDARWQILPNKIVYPTFLVALTGRLVDILFFAHSKAHSFWLLALSLLVASGFFWLLFHISRGRWIGYGDVRLGLITGTILAEPYRAMLMIFLASALGSAWALPLLASQQDKLTSKLPYGPFLIISTWLSLLFGGSIIDWYKGLLA